MAHEVVPVEPLDELSPTQDMIPIGEQVAVEQRLQNGVGWLIFIVAFSVVNSVLTLAGISWAFFAGLGVTQVIDGIALVFIEESNTASPLSVKAIAFLLDLAMTGVLAFFVLLARRKNRWAYIGATAIYIVDAILLLVLQSWLTFLFHLYVLWNLWHGFQALQLLHQWKRAGRIKPAEKHAPYQRTVDEQLRHDEGNRSLRKMVIVGVGIALFIWWVSVFLPPQ